MRSRAWLQQRRKGLGTERKVDSKIKGDGTVCVASDCLHGETHGTQITPCGAAIARNPLSCL